MPEGFNSIADLKVVIDANTEGLKGGLELAQGLISRFRGDADKDLGLFDQIMTKGSASVMTWIGRLNAVSAGLTIAGQAIDVFKEQGRKFAEETGTVEQFEKLSGSVDDLQDAIVGGLWQSFESLKGHGVALVSTLADLEEQTEETTESSENLAGGFQTKLTDAIETVSFAIRRLGPDASKSVKQLEREIEDYTTKINRAREIANDFSDGSVEGAFLPGIPDEEKLARQKQYVDGLENARFVASQLAVLQSQIDAIDKREENAKKSRELAEKQFADLEKEIKKLEDKSDLLGMTAGEAAEYVAQQRLMIELEEQGLEYTQEVNDLFAERAARIRKATEAVEAFNKAEDERKKAEQREKQIAGVVAAMDQEINGVRRKAESYSMTAAAAAGLAFQEQKLNAIKAAGRQATEAEIDLIAKRRAEYEAAYRSEEAARQNKQIGKVLGDIDAEINALNRKATATTLAAESGAGLEFVERKLQAIRAAGREPTEAEIALLEKRRKEYEAAFAMERAFADAKTKREQAERDAERQGQQVRRIIEGLDAEIDAQGRKADAFGRTAAEAAALERRERALLAIRQAGREPTEAEIAQIDAKTEALREQIEVYDRIKRAQDQLREYTRIVTSTMEDAFRDFTRGAKIDVKEMVRSMLQDLAMLTLKQSVTGPLQQGLGSILGSLLGGGVAGAGGWGATVIPAFADGGRPPLDRPSLIGERGPELWMPDVAGRVVSNEDLRDIVAGGGQGQRAGGEIVVKVAAGPELYVEIDNRADGIVTRRMPAIQAETLRQTRSALPAMLGDVRSRNNV